MKSHISKVRIMVLAVGLAIVMSSCGIQNQAGDSSSSSGKTKNIALVNGQACFETQEQLLTELSAAIGLWNTNYYNWFPSGDVYPMDALNVGNFVIGINYQNDPTGFANRYWASFISPIIGGCQDLIASVEGTVVEGTPTIAASVVNVKSCLKPDVKQAMIDGYNEQLARPLGGEVTEEYLAQMQKGLDVTKATCTN